MKLRLHSVGSERPLDLAAVDEKIELAERGPRIDGLKIVIGTELSIGITDALAHPM